MNNLLKKVVSTLALTVMVVASAPKVSFAATITDGDLVKASGSSAIYLIQDGKKRVFPHSSVYLSWGYPSNYSTVKTVTASELSAYPDGDAVIYRDGFMFRFQSVGMVGGFDPSAVFFVSDGQIRPIDSATTYMKLFNGGVSQAAAWDRVYFIPNDLLAKFTYPKGNNITSTQIDNGNLPNGLVVKDSANLYYVVKGGTLANITSNGLSANRYLANSNIFSKMLVSKLADSVLRTMPAGAPVSAADTSLLTVKNIGGQTTTDTTQAKKLVVSATPTSIEADGANQVTITATVATDSGVTVSSATNSVVFAITSGSGMLSSATVTPVNGVATVKLTPTATSAAGTVTVTASASGLTAGTVTITTVANTLAPQVATVSNSGMQIINVIFDKNVDKTSAETTSNYAPKNNKGTTVTVNNAKLLSDNKTVQLKLASGFYNDSIVDSIEVKNVQNTAQTATMTTMTKELTVVDASVPTVVAVEALGSRAVRVTFSEALQGVSAAAFRLDDKVLNAGAGTDTTSNLYNVVVTYPDAGDYTKALLTFGNGLTVGAHTLTVGSNNALTDYNVTTTGTAAVYTMQAAGYVATVAADTSVPTLSSVEVLTQTKVRYTFSKSVSTPNQNAFFYSSANNATSGTYATSVTKVSDTVYEASWSSAITTGTVYFYAGTTTNNVTDYSGNNISPVPSSKSAIVASDTAPAISSISMDTDSDRVVVVMFTKEVDESSAETSSNYVFKTSTGTILTSTTGGNGIGASGNAVATPVKDSTNAKKVTITLGSVSQDANALPGGTYQLCIANVKAVSASSSSAMTSTCSTFTVTDKTRPTLYSTTNALTIGTNVSVADAGSSYAGRIVVKYSEAMGSSALNAQNYKVLNVTGYTTTFTKLSDISGVSLSFRNSNKDVVIDFPNSVDLGATTQLMIGYIDGGTNYAPTDVSGNVFKNTANDSVSISGTVGTGFATTGLDISNAVTGLTALKITSATTFMATFARNIEAISASEFLIDNNASTSAFQPTNAIICTADNYANKATTGCDEENESKVVFTIPSGTANEFTASDTNSTVTFSTQSSTLATTKDTLGLIVVNNKVDNVTTTNDIKPILKSFVLSDANTLILTFDGKIMGTTAMTSNLNESALAGDLVISQTVGSTTTTITGGVDHTGTPSASQMKVTTGATDSSIVTITLGTALSTLNDVTVKTVAQDSMDTIGANGAKIAANTTGVANSSFVASSLVETFSAVSNVVANNETLTIQFNKNVDKTSIISTGWNSATPSVNSTTVTATFNKVDNKITFSGANIGEFEVGDMTYAGSSSTSTVVVSYNEATRTMVLTFATPSDVTTSVFGDITYTPNSSIITTDNTPVTTTFKPVDAMGGTADTTLVTATVPGATGATNRAADLVVTYAESLYNSGTALADATDYKTLFTASSGVTITSATYTAAAKTITFVLTGVVDTSTLTIASTVTDAAGNAVSTANDVCTYAATGTIWSIN